MLGVVRDPEADAVYIQLSDEPVGYTVGLDENRLIDRSMNPGKPVGADLLEVSEWVNLTGLPEADSISRTLEALGIWMVYRMSLIDIPPD